MRLRLYEHFAPLREKSSSFSARLCKKQDRMQTTSPLSVIAPLNISVCRITHLPNSAPLREIIYALCKNPPRLYEHFAPLREKSSSFSARLCKKQDRMQTTSLSL